MSLDGPKLARLETWDVVFGSVRLAFGMNCLERLGELTGELGGKRALLVTDPGNREAGHLDRAQRALKTSSIEAAVFEQAEQNPTTKHVGRGAEYAAEHRVDCIVALGGGSAMDCAKGINFLLTNGGRMEDYQGLNKATRPMLPSIGIPTTAGTGSEAQSYALISQAETRAKMACGDHRAKFRTVLLDPTTVASVPRSVAAVTGIDAVAHAVESYVTRQRNPISQMFAREAWRLLDGALTRVLSAPDDLEAWGRMLLGSYLAGAAIEHSMLGAAHACANPLTARYDVTHGVAVGLMLPHVMRLNAASVGGLYNELSAASDCTETGRPLWERVCELRATAGLPEKLRDFRIPRKGLPELSQEAAEQWTAGFNPHPVTARELLELYEAAY